MARPSKCRSICSLPRVTEFGPQGVEPAGTIVLGMDGYEVVRLLDYRQLTQEQCAVRMQVSRTTVTRIYEEARRKIAEALATGKSLRIDGGQVMVCPAPRPECAGEPYCCHRQENQEG